MARFHAKTWQEGNFDRTASIISFDSKSARNAFRMQCHQRFVYIDHKEKVTLEKSGIINRLALWDEYTNTFNVTL